MSWVRLWHDMPTDPKWRVVARKAGQPISNVLAVFTFLMVAGSQNAERRGVVEGFDAEDVAAALDILPEDVEAIIHAMQGKVLDGKKLTGWEKRQPKREDATAADRKAAWKEREKTKRNAAERAGTQRNASERPDIDTDTDTEIDIPLAKANGAGRTSDKEFWDIATAYLGGKRSLIGKWTKDHGKAETAKAITAAQLERAVDPVAYIEKTLRKAGRQTEAVPLC